MAFTDLEGDKSLYLLFAENLLDGGGFTESVALAEGNKINFFASGALSPVYSLIAAPILAITQSYIITSICIDIIAWSVLFTGLYKIAGLVMHQRPVINLFLLAVGFFLYPHELSSGPKDSLSVGLIFWCCYTAHKLIIAKEFSFLQSVSMGVLFLLLAGMKFLYSPLVILLLLILLLYALIHRNTKLLKSTAIAFIIVTAGVAGWYFYLEYLKEIQVATPFLMNVESVEKGWFLSNIKYAFPFVTSSVINTNLAGVQIEKIFGVSYAKTASIFLIIDAILLLSLTVFIIARFRKLLESIPLKIILISVASAICFMVYYMSIRNKITTTANLEGIWTFVSDARSFLFPMVIFQLAIFYTAFNSKTWPRKLAIAFVILILVEGIHGLYFTIKQFNESPILMGHRNMDSPVKKIVETIRKEEGDNAHLITTFNNLRRYALLNNVKAYPLPVDCSKVRFNTVETVYIVTFAGDSLRRKNCVLGNSKLMSYKEGSFIVDKYK